MGIFLSFKYPVLSSELGAFILYVKHKKYSLNHQKKLINYAKKASKSMYYFNLAEIMKNKENLTGEPFYKAIHKLCTYFSEKYYDNDDFLKEINKIRNVIKEPKYTPDLYTPTNEDLETNLIKLRENQKCYYQFYLGLAYSGVRITELSLYVNNPEKYKVVENGDIKKILLNYTRSQKSAYYIYLPKDFKPEPINLDVLRRFLIKNKDIIRPKYIRNWFYGKCIDLGIPANIADFYQGRTPISIGDKHYLEKEKLADKYYLKILEEIHQLNDC